MLKPKSHRVSKPLWFGILAVVMMMLWVFLAVWFPYHREQVAIREIEKLGGEVQTFKFGPVSSVHFYKRPISDEDLKHLKKHFIGLPNLTSLSVVNRRVSDDGIKYLNSLSNLRS
ncbi:MAG TPA: hypothetical protein DDZ90_30385, partial [Planctomycetaceae bacterium]|nr:hypothetical protein [Planctomycetaceae bacterium]